MNVRKSLRRWGFVIAAGILTTAATTAGDVAAAEPPTRFDDTFAGPAGSAPDPSKWGYDLGGGGWGNGEAQVYTDSRDNSRLDGSGHLLIVAQQPTPGAITSARLTTQGKFAFTEGRADASLRFPAGAGLHGAFWTLGTDIGQVGWPAAGEIDVAEVIDDGSAMLYGAHGPAPVGPYEVTGSAPVVATDFHDYWIQRTKNSITFGVDGTVLRTLTPDDLQPGQQWVYDKPMYLVLNLALGGTMPGPVGPDTAFPAVMTVASVHVTGG
ncbi:glycoside hydrolase family 16 protein [Nocardia panacis]|nr:glycoside hydrolase family 16 protein [Nocardia panacis]